MKNGKMTTASPQLFVPRLVYRIGPCLRLAKMCEERQRNSGYSGGTDQHEKTYTKNIIHTTVYMLTHQSFICSHSQNGIVGEGQNYHAENDGDVDQLERTHPRHRNDQGQEKHSCPRDGVYRDGFRGFVFAPVEIEELAHVVRPRQRCLDSSTA